MKNTRTLCLSLFLFSSYSLYSQDSFDSSYIQAANVYTKVIGANVHLFNGTECGVPVFDMNKLIATEFDVK